MAFVVTCYYGPGGARARFAIRATHLAYMIAAQPLTILGGALLDEGNEALGMLIVLDVADRQAAERFIHDEPYNRAGLFERVALSPFRLMSPEPHPGFLSEELAAQEVRDSAALAEPPA